MNLLLPGADLEQEVVHLDRLVAASLLPGLLQVVAALLGQHETLLPDRGGGGLLVASQLVLTIES